MVRLPLRLSRGPRLTVFAALAPLRLRPRGVVTLSTSVVWSMALALLGLPRLVVSSAAPLGACRGRGGGPGGQGDRHPERQPLRCARARLLRKDGVAV